MPSQQPTKLTLRTYQVGFGDCFLLTFHYPPTGGQPKERNVLIDFGSTHAKPGMKKDQMERIANDVKQVCRGKLHAVVATHRHKDHISGFATNKKGTASGNIIASLKPTVIIQPWTEHPQAAPKAKAAPSSVSNLQAFVASLAAMNSFAQTLVDGQARLKGILGPRRLKELAFLGENNIANKSAVRNLMNMGPNRYVHFGSSSGLTAILPGVKVQVLGPPTLEQTETIRTQRAKDEAEFWHLQAASMRRITVRRGRLFPRARTVGRTPPYARWFIPRLESLNAEQLFQIVRILDKAMNNTSVILLFEIGKTKLLFPGDAQIENWNYALSRPEVRKKLEGVNVYKVGHHGSLNATPKSLWKLFKHRSVSASSAARLKTFMSTCPGVHGSQQRNSEVPRRKLKQALQKESSLISTDELSGATLCHIAEFAL